MVGTGARGQFAATTLRVRPVRHAALTALVVLAAGLTVVEPPLAGTRGSSEPPAPSGIPVTGVRPVPTQARAPRADASAIPYRTRSVTWPAPATTTVRLVVAGGTSAGIVSLRPVPRGGEFAGPTSAAVQMMDRPTAQRLGVSGVVFSVTPVGDQARSGQVDVAVDYSGFAASYGGNYASRLHLVRLDPCALSTPQLVRCRTPLELEATSDPAR